MNQNSNVNYSQKRFTEKRFIAAEKTNKNLTAKTENPKTLKLLPVIYISRVNSDQDQTIKNSQRNEWLNKKVEGTFIPQMVILCL